MKLIKFLSVLSLLSITSIASANLINNGNFGTCDYTGWQKDTDGAGDFSFGNDFEINDSASPNCSAVLNVDYFETAGDPFSDPVSEAWFANTLFQDISGLMVAGKQYKLDLDYSISIEGISRPGFFYIPDYYSIGIFDGFDYIGIDGTLGFLVDPTDVFGDFVDSLSFTLDGDIFSAFSSLALDFQLGIGFDQFGSDAFGSTLSINGVSLTEIQVNSPITDVPEPSSIALLGLSLLGIRFFSRKE